MIRRTSMSAPAFVLAAGLARAAAVKAIPFLTAGDRFRCLSPKDFFGAPIVEGTCEGDTITVPCAGEFAAFVVLKEPAAKPVPGEDAPSSHPSSGLRVPMPGFRITCK
jgi:hypothetical protein